MNDTPLHIASENNTPQQSREEKPLKSAWPMRKIDDIIYQIIIILFFIIII